MLLTSFRSRMSEFTSLRLSNMDLSHRCEEKDDLERLVMANYEVDGMTTARTEVPASIQRKERALEASGIRWRYAEQGMSFRLQCDGFAARESTESD
ncbi:hypothetical protein RRF57_010272 [Xylaria bambusicola]|uniref:Uncharacterized protein n=1 Tax=Xylaria bambusicola TaxID=326684 RepID=A0AAN7V187_9PEZI